MEEPSKNSFCPCGSGKEYQHCCSGKIVSFPKKDNFEGDEFKPIAEMLEMITEDLIDKEFNSPEELNWELKRFSHNQNNLPKAPFLGLSPSQMHHILYSPFSLNNGLFHFECQSPEELTNIPLLEQSLYFLNKLNQVGPMKATQKGNLPRAFVIEFYRKFFSNNPLYFHTPNKVTTRPPVTASPLDERRGTDEERRGRQQSLSPRGEPLPNKEDDLFPCTRLKHLLTMAGLIKKRANKFSLTKKGEEIIVKKKIRELFDELAYSFFNKWNWGFRTWNPKVLCLIQDSAIFNLYLLNKKAQNWISGEELSKIYLHAFPNLIYETHSFNNSSVYATHSTPEEDVIHCFSSDFLKDVGLPLGLIQTKNNEENEEIYFSNKTHYKVSPFFKRCFKFT